MNLDELAGPLARYGGSRPTPCAQGSKMQYSDPGFWDTRFKDAEGLFDWYATYEELSDAFEQFCPASAVGDQGLLVVGCGNSSLSSDLHSAGYANITNIDVSAPAVEKMQGQFEALPMQWMVMDATSMSFPSNSFGVSVDKGTLDAMMSSYADDLAGAMCREVWRVLQPGGIFILVSHSSKRMPILRSALGKNATWRCLELRRCRLSPQATLINVLRSKLPPKGKLVDAFRDPQLLQQASSEAKAALKRMAFIDAFRLFKARKRAQAGLEERHEADEAEELPGEEDLVTGAAGESRDPRLQPFCWIYVLRKSWLGVFSGLLAVFFGARCTWMSSVKRRRCSSQELLGLPIEEALQAAALGLFDPLETTRAMCCATLAELLRNAGPDAELGTVGQDVLRHVLAQVASNSGEVRLAAMEVLQHFPRWDTEVLNKAVKLPIFRKVLTEEENPAGSGGKSSQTDEIWHGALFFALDDEEPMIRARALHVLRVEMCQRRASEEVPEFKGFFQRLAAVAALCLQDTSDMVRQQATALLMEIMSVRSVGLARQLVDKASAPLLTHVLQAFPRDPAAVLGVLEKARFADLQALYDAVLWILNVELPQGLDSLDLEPVAFRLAEELERLEAMPEVYKKAKKTLMMDSAAQPGVRLLTSTVLYGSDPIAPAGIAVGLSQGRGSTQMERLRVLVDQVSLRSPGAAEHLRGDDALSPSRISESPKESTLTYWIQSLEWHWDVVATGLTEAPYSDRLRVAASRMSQLQQHLSLATAEACSDEDASGPVGSDGASRFAAAAAWAEALKSLAEAAQRSYEMEGVPPRASVKLHQAVSWLMHGFLWPVQPFPRILLALRLLSLRLLADAKPTGFVLEDLEKGVQELGGQMPSKALETATSSRLLQRPIGDFMPAMGKGFLQTLLNAPVKLRTARLRWTELGRPKMRSDGLRPLPISVDVAHSFPRGLFLADSSKAVLEKVPPSGSSLRTQRVECIAPGPWFSLWLLLDVDDASLGALGVPSLAGGSTGVSSQSGLHRYVNQIAVADPMEVNLLESSFGVV
ncbi:unnamed protein product [Symbiodinium sp. CCMP2456]|nr:unnamed protein product [Symbiodinium sp. CCMP2456]